jgi:hypothetical protein
MGDEIFFAVKSNSSLPSVISKLNAIKEIGERVKPPRLIESAHLAHDERFKFLVDSTIKYAEDAGYSAINLAWNPAETPLATTGLIGREYKRLGNFGPDMTVVKIKLKE